MAYHCKGDLHFYPGTSNICACGEDRWGADMHIPNMHHPRHQQWQQQPKSEAADVPLPVFKAAQAVNATHLSADGSIAYDERQLGLWYCKWDEEAKAFGSWFKILDGGLPEGAVKVDG